MENLYWSAVEFMYCFSADNAMHEGPRAAVTQGAAHTLRPVVVPAMAVAPSALNRLRTHTAGLAEVAHLD
jgi:hypothetical protein